MNRFAQIIYVLAGIALSSFFLLAIIFTWAMFASMGCWIWYGAHTSAWLLQHCG